MQDEAGHQSRQGHVSERSSTALSSPQTPNHLAVESLTSRATAAAEDATRLLKALESERLAAAERLKAESDAIRRQLQEEAARAEEVAENLERAARALVVRALEADNRDEEAEQRAQVVHAAATRLEEFRAQRAEAVEARARDITVREANVAAREAGLRYSAVEQMRLHAWARELEAREKRIGEAENAEKDRIQARRQTLDSRERVVEAREKRIDVALREREATLRHREVALEEARDALDRERAEAALTLESERSQFWTHQQKVSAVVAAETEALLAEQARLRTEFEADAANARKLLQDMQTALARLKADFDMAASMFSPADARFQSSELRNDDGQNRTSGRKHDFLMNNVSTQYNSSSKS